jgi:hypothetical protein
VKQVETVIRTLESIISDYEHRSAKSRLAVLRQNCVDLSRLECFLPGAYSAASSILNGIHAAEQQSPLEAQQHMTNAVQLLRRLPIVS